MAEANKVNTVSGGDPFKFVNPSFSDLKTLNSLPPRPNNPTIPAPYAGPKIKKASDTGDAVINKIDKKSGSSNAIGTGSWANYQYTDFALTDSSALALTVGKSWGNMGYGGNDGVSKTASTG